MSIDVAQRTWNAALGRLQIQVTRPSFDTWLRDTTGLAQDSGRLVVGVPSTFAAEWLERRMHGLIEAAVAAVAPDAVTVIYRVQGSEEPPTVPTSAPASTEAATATAVSPVRAPATVHTGLSRRYTFDGFVVGGSNQLAYAAAMAVASAPGAAYNPLFLYGAAGLGKTHLLHAVGNQAASQGAVVRYVTTEEFTNDYLAAIRDRRADTFRHTFRSVDVLLVDDIQFLAGKESTQEGFFHTFNALYESDRQVVVACDRPPGALPLLEERLRSRFESGLIADLGQPDVETRLAILSVYAGKAPVPVPQDVLAFLAARGPASVRTLQGWLNRVTALAHFTDTDVSVSLAESTLGSTVAAAQTPASPKAVISGVAAHHQVSEAALLGSNRSRPVALARHTAMYLLHEVLHLSLDTTGEIMGGRDRTSVRYAVRKVAEIVTADAVFAATIEALRDGILHPSR